MDISSSGNRRRSSAASAVSSSSGAGAGVGVTAAGSTSTATTSVVSAQAAAQSLQLLLREDSLLREYGLTESKSNPDQVAFPYAAALLNDNSTSSGEEQQRRNQQSSSLSTKQRADLALQDVERKLALVESLAVKLSRTRPEAVAGHLLRLHGYELSQQDNETTTTSGSEQQVANANANANNADANSNSLTTTGTTTLTLASMRDRSDRLERQADLLDSVAKRVETSLSRGLTRMEAACLRLERVLTLSSTLKSILRLEFECHKLLNYDLDDTRDLTRAAASVAILEDLLQNQLAQQEREGGIHVVDRMRPQIQATGRQVREAAAVLLAEQYSSSSAGAAQATLPQLGATLQVYYHLGELPSAVWKAMDEAHAKAEAVTRELFNPVTLLNLTEQAKRSSANNKEARSVQKKLSLVRAEAAQKWASGMTKVALQVRTMQRVLCRKTDPVSRQVYVDVVMSAPTPAVYAEFVTLLQQRGGSSSSSRSSLPSIFSLFWERVCRSMSSILTTILRQDQAKYAADVAALYPPVRAAAIELMSRLQESSGNSAMLMMMYEDDASSAADGGGGPTTGILGGSSILDDDFLGWTTGQETEGDEKKTGDNPQAGAADVWTRQSDAESAAGGGGGAALGQNSSQWFLTSGPSTVPLSAVFQSPDWIALQGYSKTRSGLYPLQQAFVESCTERLCAPLQYMFPENVTLDDDGLPISSGLALLPSKYDIQRFDENIRQEFSLTDPREGGGDLSSVPMIAECVVTMIFQFCDRAKNAISGVGEEGYLQDDWTMTASLQHDRKVVAIMYTMARNLKSAPDKTFVAPYRPATSAQHEEAAALCQAALVPAIQEINKMVKSFVLNPLCRALNRRISSVLAKMHHGVYIDSGGGFDVDSPAFVQKHLSDVFEIISQNHLSRFPPEYAAAMASRIAAFTIYAFVSNASLVRPLGENARLHITQDLADLELSLEQLVLKSGGTQSLHQIENGKPYAELRAVRQMLFWTGLESHTISAQDASKALLREVWIKDVRPSTVFHYLFSFAPSLLSSPHHAKRIKAEEYVATLVKLNGSVEDGEDAAWMTTMSCCDSYQQRASSVAGDNKMDGDARIPQILMLLGQELMRRRRH